MSRYDIRTYAVIGAGNMGSGIAQKIATEGYPVILVDLDDEKVARGLDIIKTTLEEGVERRIFKPEQAEQIRGRIRGTSDWTGLSEADLVIEAVFEDLDVKKKVFTRLAEVCRPDCILSTNTSSFYVKDVAAAATNPERVVGLHYFYHPAKNRLVEVVGHAGTDEDAFNAAWAAQEAIGKVPIRSADAPGFVVNRYFVPWVNEAVRLLEEGVADIPTIEAAAKKAFRIGMGPFELMNVTGIPIAMHAADTLGRELGNFYAPAEALKTKVADGGLWDLAGTADESKFDAVAHRLLGATFYIASKLVAEGVSTVEDTDIGARVGLRWSKGPFELMNRNGVPQSRDMAARVMEKWHMPLEGPLSDVTPAEIPIELVSAGNRAGLNSVWINRPDAMNALNEAVVGQFGAAIDAAQEAGGKGIMIGGSGKAFVAGADIKFFVDHLRAGTFPKIRSFTAEGQRILAGFAKGKQPVVARVQGLALGGGAELTLACDYIVASPKATFGFPETGIGIYPGLGGTQRLPRRVGVPIAKYLVYTGQIIDSETARAIGLCDAVASFSDLDATCAQIVTEARPAHRTIPDAPLEPSWKPIWDFFDAFSVDQILSGQADTNGNPILEKAVKRMHGKSTSALRLAERLFNEGCDLPLDQGLAMELDLLEEVFSTPDALEGLSSLIEGRRPEFAGS